MLLAAIPAATCGASPDYVPWSISDDKVLVCLVKSGDAPTKTIMSLADTMCTVTKERGITELKLVDHSLRPKMKAWWFQSCVYVCINWHKSDRVYIHLFWV